HWRLHARPCDQVDCRDRCWSEYHELLDPYGGPAGLWPASVGGHRVLPNTPETQLNVVPADVADKVFGARGSDVLGVVHFIGADHAHVSRTQPVGLAINRQLH